MIDRVPVGRDEPALFSLVRVAKHETGAYGALLHGGVPFAVTLERTYTVNGTEWVKIPAGRYHCRRTRYYRGDYETFEIMVPGHSRVLFHKLNTEDESEGCVGIAESFGHLRGKPAILNSAHGFREFMELAADRAEFVLEVC